MRFASGPNVTWSTGCRLEYVLEVRCADAPADAGRIRLSAPETELVKPTMSITTSVHVLIPFPEWLRIMNG